MTHALVFIVELLCATLALVCLVILFAAFAGMVEGWMDPEDREGVEP